MWQNSAKSILNSKICVNIKSRNCKTQFMRNLAATAFSLLCFLRCDKLENAKCKNVSNDSICSDMLCSIERFSLRCVEGFN